MVRERGGEMNRWLEGWVMRGGCAMGEWSEEEEVKGRARW